MSIPAVDTHEPALPVVKRTEWLALGRVVFALALIVVGGASLALNLGLVPLEQQRLLAALWPAGVIVAGLGLILFGVPIWQSEPALFTVMRGETQDADLHIQSGTADVHVQASSSTSELLSGELARPQQPKVTVREHHTAVRLAPLWSLPALGRGQWSAALAKDVPWQILAGSSTGNLNLDLRELMPQMVRVRSTFGDVDLGLPVAGGADLDIHLQLGDLTIAVPDGLAVKVTLHQGILADVVRDERRFIRLSPQEIGTPLYAVAAKRCTLDVWLGTGHLTLK